MDITKRLFGLRDENYAAFQSRLTPGVPPETFIGVRLPLLRKLAKEYAGEPASDLFLKELPHQYYDENMLHALLISAMKETETMLSCLEAFLPYVDNWTVCDTLSPKAFKNNQVRLLDRTKAWIHSPHLYTVRFGIKTLMTFYLDEAFRPEYLALPASVHSEEYYVNMMTAWFFATALAKQWEAAVPYLENNVLDVWTHNKTIQKAIESYRITDEQKQYLRTLKRTKNKGNSGTAHCCRNPDTA